MIDGRREIRFVRPLGKGGFGSVHLAEVVTDEGLNQRLAVKILHGERSLVPEIAARARDEARLLSQVNHDNVVKVFGLTEVNGLVAVLMEYVDGVDCAALVFDCRRRLGGGLPPRVAARICECVASALHTAWTGLSPETGYPLHIVHRDIKPTNILLSTMGVVKVMDFGLARGEIGREARTAAMDFGTRRYMAPERILDGEAGARSDVYSLGATFLEILTGTRFDALPVRQGEFKRELAERIEAVRGLEEQWSVTGISPLLGHLLAYAPEDRFSAQEAERLFANWGDALPGPELRRYAADVLPPLLERRMAKLAQDQDLVAVTTGEVDSHVLSGVVSDVASRPQQPGSQWRDGGWIQLLGVLLGVGMVAYGLQFRASKLEELVWMPQTETTEHDLKWVVDQRVVDAAERANQSLLPETEGVRTFNPLVPGEDSRKIESRPVSSITPRLPIRVIELVSLKVLADPREGTLRTGTQVVDVGGRIEVEVGEHRFEFRGENWEVECMGLVTTTASRIKFFRDAGLCELR